MTIPFKLIEEKGIPFNTKLEGISTVTRCIFNEMLFNEIDFTKFTLEDVQKSSESFENELIFIEDTEEYSPTVYSNLYLQNRITDIAYSIFNFEAPFAVNKKRIFL